MNHVAEWNECREIEARSLPVVIAWLNKTDPGIQIMTNEAKTREETIAAQESMGDFIIRLTKEPHNRYIELKSEQKTTGNVFLEMWVDRNKLKPGWWQKTKATQLFFHFVDSDLLTIVDTQRLRALDLSRFTERRMKKRRSPGDVWGLVVPIELLTNTAGAKIFNPISELEQGSDVPLQVPSS